MPESPAVLKEPSYRTRRREDFFCLEKKGQACKDLVAREKEVEENHEALKKGSQLGDDRRSGKKGLRQRADRGGDAN